MIRWQTFGLTLVLALCQLATTAAAASSSEATVENARIVLTELLAIPGRGIPAKMLQDAQAVVIVPDVIKIGFIGGVRRGHGVVLVRDPDGDWGAPQFLTLTGGSFGWQIGAQATDVVLVFRSERSVRNLLSGKFTLGVDAAAAAGPVGRNAAAATDAQLRAEILSYSRSRGLFAGVSLDGSVLQIDQRASSEFYGSAVGELPARIPTSAVTLIETVARITGGGVATAPGGAVAASANDINTLRAQLATASTGLQKLLTPEWQKYLALPAEIYGSGEPPALQSLDVALSHFQQVATDQQFAVLSQRPEFSTTMDLLQIYRLELAQAANSRLQLPPPPR